MPSHPSASALILQIAYRDGIAVSRKAEDRILTRILDATDPGDIAVTRAALRDMGYRYLANGYTSARIAYALDISGGDPHAAAEYIALI